MGIRKTEEVFVNQIRSIHGDKYEYHLVNYVGNKVKVKVVCKEHGVFEKIPSDLLRGQGCQMCVGKGRRTTETFITDARAVHGEKYDYSLVRYKSIHRSVKIICPEHGMFEQQPSLHLHQKSGCPLCGRELQSAAKIEKASSIFVRRAEKVHGKRYDYSKTVYTGKYASVEVLCEKHGSFLQEARIHLRGHGCPSCAGHDQMYSYIHEVLDGDTPVALKLGISKDWSLRLKGLNRRNLFSLSNLGVWRFETTTACKRSEIECKQVLSTGVLSEREVRDGYTETVSVLDLEKIIAIYERNGGVRIK